MNPKLPYFPLHFQLNSDIIKVFRVAVISLLFLLHLHIVLLSFCPALFFSLFGHVVSSQSGIKSHRSSASTNTHPPTP
jgi:hypothetical protein